VWCFRNSKVYEEPRVFEYRVLSRRQQRGSVALGRTVESRALAPFRNSARRIQVSLAGVRVVYLVGEELHDAFRGFRRRRDKRRRVRLGRREKDQVSAHPRGAGGLAVTNSKEAARRLFSSSVTSSRCRWINCSSKTSSSSEPGRCQISSRRVIVSPSG